MFGSIPGVEVIDSDVRNEDEELDLVLWNEQNHLSLKPWDNIILVECKNWHSPAGSVEVNWFITKMRERGLSNGILVAYSGVTGNFKRAAGRLIFNALHERIRLIVLTIEDLRAIDGRVSLCDLLKQKYCRLFLGKIV